MASSSWSHTANWSRRSLGSFRQPRQDDVVLVDFADMAYPPGINPLDATLGRDRDKAVDNLITIFERIWSNSWGPRTENVLEFALKTLADANQLHRAG